MMSRARATLDDRAPLLEEPALLDGASEHTW